ncbi:MAG TPA: hypothetical protein VEX63_06455, partial [Flavisolibacter sp.]|nr:hypothetical protein [Flavisolibacter sp.]
MLLADIFSSFILLKSLALQTIQKLQNDRVSSLHSLHYFNQQQMSNSEKLKALKLTMDKIDKDFGKG